jgi:RimJ/RimL family protein N-acetyltransferase
VIPAAIAMRRTTERDAAAVLALANDAEVRRRNPVRGVVDLDSAAAWCRESADWSVGAHATWAIVDGADRLIGTCALFDIDAGQATAGLGYRVSPHARRAGVARRATDTAARYGFEDLALVRIQLAHSVGNEASCRVATAAGFAPEGTLRSAYLDFTGVRHDEHLHGRLATDPAPGLADVPLLED